MSEQPVKQPPGEVFGLTYQQQPTSFTCVHTCIAMALGVPVKDVIDRAGPHPLNQAKLISILNQCGVVFDVLMFAQLGIFKGWHFATVPSLNIRGGNHQVLIRWTEEDGLTVLDPARGEPYARDGSDLKGWMDLVPFWPGGGLPPDLRIS